jgi:hypothetical protein
VDWNPNATRASSQDSGVDALSVGVGQLMLGRGEDGFAEPANDEFSVRRTSA